MADQPISDALLAKAFREEYPGAYDKYSDAEIASAVRKDRPDFLADFYKVKQPSAAELLTGKPESELQRSPLGDMLAPLAHPEGLGDFISLLLPTGESIARDAWPMAKQFVSTMKRGYDQSPTIHNIPGSMLRAFIDQAFPVTGRSAAEADVMLGRGGSPAVPAAPGAPLPPARDLYPLFKAGETPRVNPASPPRHVRMPPSVAETLQSALEDAKKPAGPSKVSLPPEPSITPAGKEGDFYSSGRPSVTAQRYDEMNGAARAEQEAAGVKPPQGPGGQKAAPTSEAAGDKYAKKNGIADSTPAHQEFADMMARKGAKVEKTSTGESVTPATMYKVAGYNTDRQVERAIADGDFEEAGRIMASGLDNFFGGTVAKWAKSGKTPAIATALAEGLRRQIQPVLDSDAYQSADDDKQQAMIRRALNNPQKRKQLLSLAGGR